MERQNLENEFREAFEGAGQEPSANAWVNIELELERAEGKKMKRRVLVYQMLAAASVTFAILVAGGGYFAFKNNNIQVDQIASNQSPLFETDLNTPTQGTDTSDKPLAKSSTGNSSTDDLNNASTNRFENENEAETKSGKNFNADHQGTVGENLKRNSVSSKIYEMEGVAAGKNRNQMQIQSENESVKNDSEKMFSQSTDDLSAEGNLAHLQNGEGLREVETKSVMLSSSESNSNEVPGNQKIIAGNELPVQNPVSKLRSPSNEEESEKEISIADPGLLLLAQLKDLEKELAGEEKGKKKNKKDQSSEKLWTSIGFAAGGYNGQANTASSPNMLAINGAVENQSKASGAAYSVGISMGTKITERLVIQGGFNYLTNSSNYTANQVVRSENLRDFKPASINDLRAAESSLFANDMLIPTAPHTVNNNIEFVSIPMQAGYLIIDKKFGLQFNAGVSTDFFLQNTIDSQGSDLKKTTQERGADSPYRSTNFSGLMSTEFNYRLGTHYRLALNPGLRYPLNSIYKDETGIESTPLTFDVGLRFRYIFR
jgi:hypothetical protein